MCPSIVSTAMTFPVLLLRWAFGCVFSHCCSSRANSISVGGRGPFAAIRRFASAIMRSLSDGRPPVLGMAAADVAGFATPTSIRKSATLISTDCQRRRAPSSMVSPSITAPFQMSAEIGPGIVAPGKVPPSKFLIVISMSLAILCSRERMLPAAQASINRVCARPTLVRSSPVIISTAHEIVHHSSAGPICSPPAPPGMGGAGQHRGGELRCVRPVGRPRAFSR
jgi:hypothetical protein